LEHRHASIGFILRASVGVGLIELVNDRLAVGHASGNHARDACDQCDWDATAHDLKTTTADRCFKPRRINDKKMQEKKGSPRGLPFKS
jgi:hypothetical protein